MKVSLQRVRIPQSYSGAVRFSTEPNFGQVQCVMAFTVNSGANANIGDTSNNSKAIMIGFSGTSGSTVGPTNIMCSTGIATSTGLATIQAQRGTRNTDWASSDSNRGTRYRLITPVFGIDQSSFSNAGKAAAGTTYDDFIIVSFGGVGLSSAVNSNTLGQTLDSQVVISGLTFQPDLIFGSWNGQQAVNTSTNTDAIITFGAASRNNKDHAYVLYNIFNGGTAVTTKAGIGTDMLWKRPSAYNASTTTASPASGGGITSFNADGFTYQTLISAQPASGYQLNYLAMKFSESVKVGTFLTPTGTGVTFVYTGFPVQFVMGASTGSSVLQAQPQTNLESGSVNLWFAQGNNTSKFIEGIGTITCVNTGIAVTGTGTSFYQQIGGGDILYGPSYQLIGTVSGVATSTSLALTANSSVSLAAGSNYYYTSSKNYTLFFGDRSGNTGSRAYVGTAQTAPLDATNAGSFVTALTSGQVITFSGQNGFYVNYTNTFQYPQYNWYTAIGAEQRRKRRQSG